MDAIAILFCHFFFFYQAAPPAPLFGEDHKSNVEAFGYTVLRKAVEPRAGLADDLHRSMKASSVKSDSKRSMVMLDNVDNGALVGLDSLLAHPILAGRVINGWAAVRSERGRETQAAHTDCNTALGVVAAGTLSIIVALQDETLLNVWPLSCWVNRRIVTRDDDESGYVGDAVPTLDGTDSRLAALLPLRPHLLRASRGDVIIVCGTLVHRDLAHPDADNVYIFGCADITDASAMMHAASAMYVQDQFTGFFADGSTAK